MLIGKEVIFLSEKLPNAQADKEFGKVWAGKNPNQDVNVTIALLSEGLAKLRDTSRNHPQNKELAQVEEDAKSHGKGIWSSDAQVIYIFKLIMFNNNKRTLNTLFTHKC